MASPLFRPFPGPPPFPRLPAKWDDKSAHKWSRDLLRVLDQQVNPLVNVVVNVSTTYTVLTTNANAIVVCDASGGAFTVTLPGVANMVHHTVSVKNKPGGANVTVNGGGALIDGAATITVVAPNARLLVSDGTTWHII